LKTSLDRSLPSPSWASKNIARPRESTNRFDRLGPSHQDGIGIEAIELAHRKVDRAQDLEK
jgi:hypothetical protein